MTEPLPPSTQYCEKCDHLTALYERSPKSDRDYWLATELFVHLHGRDYCNHTHGSIVTTIKRRN